MLRVRIFAAPNAELALFVRQGRKPTENLFKCRQTLDGRHATCRIEDPDPGGWWAGVVTAAVRPASVTRSREDQTRAQRAALRIDRVGLTPAPPASPGRRASRQVRTRVPWGVGWARPMNSDNQSEIAIIWL